MIASIADSHIGKCIRKGIAELEKDGAEALGRMLDAILVKAHGEPVHLLVAGDSADTVSIDGAGIQGLVNQLNAFVDKGNTVYYIQGNHDKQRSSMHSKPILDSVHNSVYLHNNRVVVEGKVIRGLDYTPPESLKEALKTKDVSCDILVLHAAFEEILPFANAFDLSFEDVPSTVGTVIAGDIHTARKLQLVAGENRFFVSPGGVHSCAVDQKGPFGFWTLVKDDWIFTACPTREIVESDLTEMETVESLGAFIQQLTDTARALPNQANLKPILNLKWDRSRSDLFDKCVEVLQSTYVILEEAYTSNGKALDVKELQRAMTDFKATTMDVALPFVCDAAQTPQVYKLLEQCLTTKEALPVVEGFINMAKAGTI